MMSRKDTATPGVLKRESSFANKKRSSILGGSSSMIAFHDSGRRRSSITEGPHKAMYRRPSNAMTSLRPQTPAILRVDERTSPSAGAGFQDLSDQPSVAASPALSPMHGSPLGRALSVDSGDGGSPLLMKNISFRNLFGESIMSGEKGEGFRKKSLAAGSANDKLKTSKRPQGGKQKGGLSGVSAKVMQQANQKDSLLEDIREQGGGTVEQTIGIGATACIGGATANSEFLQQGRSGFRRVGTDAAGKVVREDFATNLYWRECLNDAAIHRELVLYNYVLSHSARRTSSFSTGNSNLESSSFAPWGGSIHAAATQQVDVDTTVQLGGRLVQKAPDWSVVPIRKPAIRVDFLLTLEGSDQRYVSVGASGSASDATTSAKSLLQSTGGGASGHDTSAGRGSTMASLTSSFSSMPPSDTEGSGSGKTMFRVVPFVLTEPYDMTLEEACKTPGRECDASQMVGWLKDVISQLACMHQIGVSHNITTADTVVLCANPDFSGSSDVTKKRPSTGAPPFVAKISNMSCATVFDEKKLIDLSTFTMRQQRASVTNSPYHTLPLGHMPVRVHHLPPEWTSAPITSDVGVLSMGGKKGKKVGMGSDRESDDTNNVLVKKEFSVGDQPARRRGSVLLGKMAVFSKETIAVDSATKPVAKREADSAHGKNPFSSWGGKRDNKLSSLQSLVQSNRRVVPTKASDSYFFGKLLSYIFFSSGGSTGGGSMSEGGVTFKTSPAQSTPPPSALTAGPLLATVGGIGGNVTRNQQAGLGYLDPVQQAALAAQQAMSRFVAQFPLNPNMVQTDRMGLVELKHLIECLVRKSPNNRWLLEHAADHPFFWSAPVIRAFIGLVLQYVGSVASSSRRRPSVRNGHSTTTTSLAKRKRRSTMSHDLMLWVNSPVLWLPTVQDWYDAMCRDNHEGVRYDYENSVEDQLQFFVNVYEHLTQYKTKTICNGDAAMFAKLFVHNRFPGLLHTLSVRVLADRQDEEQLVHILEHHAEAASLSDLRAVTSTFTGALSMLPPPSAINMHTPPTSPSANAGFSYGGGGGEIQLELPFHAQSHVPDGVEDLGALGSSPQVDPLLMNSADPEVMSESTSGTINSFVHRLALDLRDHQLM